MVTAEQKQYIDPEPWVHRWPNSRNEDIRSAEEHCTVKDCNSTFEPRTGNELRRLFEKKSTKETPWTRLVDWCKELWGNLTR